MQMLAQYWLPPDLSTHGSDIDLLIHFLHWFMFALFAAWGVFFVYCLVRFRQRAGQTASYHPIKAKASKYGEILVVVVEAVLLIGFSIPVWARTKEKERFPASDEALEVRVVAQQFAWNVHYPGADGLFGPTDPKLNDEAENPIGLDRSHPAAKDDIVSVNVMHVPVDKPVIVRVSSKDVIHSFWIPMLRIKQDAIPGMSIPIWFQAETTSAKLRADMVRTVELPADQADIPQWYKRVQSYVAMQDYGVPGEPPILPEGGLLTAAVLAELHAAGITEIRIAPREPIEIHCAQLCGLQHYSMRGFLTVETEEEFSQWLAKQAMFLDTGDDWDDWEEEDEGDGDLG